MRIDCKDCGGGEWKYGRCVYCFARWAETKLKEAGILDRPRKVKAKKEQL